jgi:hypothetical protein
MSRKTKFLSKYLLFNFYSLFSRYVIYKIPPIQTILKEYANEIRGRNTLHSNQPLFWVFG